MQSSVPLQEYVPLTIEIAKGSLVCDQESLLALCLGSKSFFGFFSWFLLNLGGGPWGQKKRSTLLDASHEEDCHHACQLNNSCRFFWVGSAAAVQQCRLYTACPTLLTEVRVWNLAAQPRKSSLHNLSRQVPAASWQLDHRRKSAAVRTQRSALESAICRIRVVCVSLPQ